MEVEGFPEVVKWLRGRKEGTKEGYLSALRAFEEYTKLTPTQLIDEAEEDRELGRRGGSRGAPEARVAGFYEWLLKEYVQKKFVGSRKETGKIGVSENLARTYCGAAIRSFYKANGFRLGEEGIELHIPKGANKRENLKLMFGQAEMRRLFDVCTSLRDKTIALAMYQGFLRVAQVCSLNYGDVARELESGEKFLTVHMRGRKRRNEYYTVLGEEFVDTLRLYLNERRANGDVLEFDSPLFTKEGRQKLRHVRMASHLIENSFRKLTLKAELVSQRQLEAADINPARPDALKSSGMNVAKLSGMNEKAVKFMAGDRLDKSTMAFWMARPEELKELYRRHYHVLRVLSPKPETEKIRELEEDIKDRDETIRALAENGRLKDERLKRLEEELRKLREDYDKMTAHLTTEEKRRILSEPKD